MKGMLILYLLIVMVITIAASPVVVQNWRDKKSYLTKDLKRLAATKEGGDLEGSESAYVFYPHYPYYPVYHYPYVLVGK